MLEFNYRPKVKKYELGYKVSDIKEAARKDGLIELGDLTSKVEGADLNDLLDFLDERQIPVFKPFNTEEQWQWFISKNELGNVVDWFRTR